MMKLNHIHKLANQFLEKLTAQEAQENDPSFQNINLSSDQKVFLSSMPFSLSQFKNISQISNSDGSFKSLKPKGLWYACGDDWIKWTSREMSHWLEDANFLYEITLGDNILQINNNNEFQLFEDKYSEMSYRTPHPESSINWKKVQNDGFNGIEICPYLFDKRMDAQWYYGWDVASGCIWNKSGIADVSLIAQK